MTGQDHSGNLQALGLIVLGASMVSFTSVLVKLANVGPTISAFYRMLFGALILIVIALIKGDRLWYDMRRLVLPLICALFFALDLYFWHRSIIFVGPGLATILGNMQVFFVTLFAVWFMKERLGRRLMAAIPIAVFGLFLIVRTGWGQQDGNFKLGVLFGLLTAVCYAGYILALRKSQSAENSFRFSLISNMAWISLLAAGILGIAALTEPDTTFAIPNLQSLWALLGLGVMGQVLGWVLISKGLPNVEASVAGLAILLQPALAFAWDILFFDRPTIILEYAGAGLVLAAIYLGSTGNKRKR